MHAHLAKRLALATIALIPSLALAQGPLTSADSAWRFSGNASLTANQILLKNWIAGGNNAISGEASTFLQLDYAKNASSWVSTLELAYGLTKQGESDPIKHLDKIELTSKYGYKAYQHWFYSALLGLKTQFAPGYKERELTSDLLAPLYLSIALGADYQPNTHFSLLIAPATARLTHVGNKTLRDIGAFGVKPGQANRAEIGGQIRAAFNQTFLQNRLGLLAKLELFSNYLEKPKKIDVALDLTLDYKIMDFLTAKFQFSLIYDDDQKSKNEKGSLAPMLQTRQMLGVGLAYRF